MNKRTFSGALMLLLATQFCYASDYTMAVAGHIIVILSIIVIALVLLICYGIYNNRVISQRNRQLLRILTALDEYRALVADGILSLDMQEELLKNKKPTESKVVQQDEEQSFFVMMDARINKERPFTNPDFDQDALIQFMGVSREAFYQLVPRYKEPARTLDYINSLRAEYAAKILLGHSDFSMDVIARKCGFRDTVAFNQAFKFSFGITPTDYLSGKNQMFKKK